MQKVPMTEFGAEQLRNELKKLKSNDRPEIIEAIAEARAHGDLKENAEYHAAKERQSFTEGRIAEIEGKLSHAYIVEITNVTDMGKVVFGATITLLNLETEDNITYQIVGEDEADLKHAKISIGSPLARALIGKVVGDVVEVNTPTNQIEYEIKEIEYK